MRQILSPLDGIRSPFGRLLGSVFSPALLFALAEPGVWYDPSDVTTLFQDTAGTTPVTTPGQTVALALDKSKGLVKTKTTLPTFTVNEGSGATTISVTSNVLTFTSAASGDGKRINGYFTLGRRVYIRVTAVGTGSVAVFAGNTTPVSISSSGVFVGAIGNANADYLIFRASSGGYNGTITVEEIFEQDGFHATQATAGSRPIYGIVPVGGRRNLLERSEEFDNAYWAKTNGTTTANAGVAPNGTTTADKFIPNTSAVSHSTERLVSSIFSSGDSVTFSCRVKADPYAFVGVSLYNQPYTGEVRATFNLTTLSSSTGTLGTAPTGVTATISDIGNDWRLLRVSCTFASGTGVTPSVVVNPTNSGVFTISTAGDGTSGILLWGAQLETGSTATNYQKVTTQYDVTEAGVSSLSYLAFDGVDDFLITPTITPGIDKAQVFAGVRALSTAANQTIYATDPLNSVAGSFGLRVNTATALQPLLYGSLLSSSTPTIPSIPVTLVTTQLADIGAASGSENGLRVNGGSTVFATNNAGTGNLSAQPIYIGRYLGTASPSFNGQIFSLIVRFGANLTADQITSTETWVNGKTRAY